MKKPNIKGTIELMNYAADMFSPACAVAFIILIYQILILYPIYFVSKILKPFAYLIK